MYIIKSIKELLWRDVNQQHQELEIQKQQVDQWKSSDKTIQDMKLYLFKQKNVNQIIQNVHEFVAQISNKQLIKQVIINYRIFLRNQKQRQVVQKFKILEQINLFNKYESFLGLIQSQFSYEILQILNYATPYNLLQKAIQLQLDFSQKKQIVLQLIPYCYQSIQNFVIDYIDQTLDFDDGLLELFMINAQELKLINRHEQNEILNLKFFQEIHQKILMMLVTQFNNFEQSIKYLKKLQQINYFDFDYKQIYFHIQLCAFTFYKLNRYDLHYNQISTITISQLFTQILLSHNLHILKQLKSIFDIIDQQYLSRCLEDYAFDQSCDMQITIQMLKKEFIGVTESTCSKLIHKLQNGYFEYSKYIQSINYVFGQFYADQIQDILVKLQFARIFYFFSINNKMSIIKQIVECKDSLYMMTLQQNSLALIRLLITNYCLNKFKEKHITIDDVTIDMSSQHSILDVCLYLKQNLFNKLLNETTIFQMIFQHLIHFSRFNHLNVLLQKKILHYYAIEYTIIQIIVIQQIYSLFQKSMSFSQIEADLKYMIKLINTQTSQKKMIVSVYQLACYLHSQDISIPPMKLIHNLNIQLLYQISEINPLLNFDKIFVLIIIAKSFNMQRLESKQYLKFKGKLAIKLYENGYQDYGNKILYQINSKKPSWLYQIIFQIIKIYKGKYLLDLLILGFDAAKNRNHFKQCQIKYTFQQQKKTVKPIQNKGTTYLVTDLELILDSENYTRIVSQAKFAQPTLQFPEFELFFILLANDHNRAFYYSISENLQFQKIEFFIKRCIQQGIINPILVYGLMFKTMLYGLSKNYLHKNVKFNKFKVEVSEKDFLSDCQRYELYQKLITNEELKKSNLMKLLINYREYVKISFILSIKYLDQHIQTNKIINYFQDQNYRKKLIKKLIIQNLPKHHIITLSKICQFDHISLTSLIIDIVADYINTNNFPKQLLSILINLQFLCQNQQDLKIIINHFTRRSHSIKNFAIFIMYLFTTNCKLFQSVIIVQNITVLESLAKIDIQNSLQQLLSQDCLTKPFNFDCNMKLSEVQKQKLKECVKLENIFVISKAMYLMNGLNKGIQKQIWQIFSNKSNINKEIWKKIKQAYN